MKNLKLILTVAAISLLQTACGGGDKSSGTPTATQNACWSSGGDPNSSACKTLAQAVAHPISSAEVPAQGQSQLANATGQSNPAVVAATAGTTAPSGMVIASVNQPSEATVKAQSQKIQSALSSYSENPDSSFYDPSEAAAKRSVASAVSPSEIAPASVVTPVAPVPTAPPGVVANAESASSR